LERRFRDLAAYSAAVAEERFALPNTFTIDHVALVVHNPYAVTPVSHDIFASVPQLLSGLLSGQGRLYWTDGAELL
jgi:hypothetical protein